MTRRDLILASASPRRQELLGLLGAPFSVEPSGFDEEALHPAPPPPELARALALGKARDVHARRNGGSVVLGADTIVVAEGPNGPEVLNKPADADDARRMLRMLSGVAHWVYTGVAVLGPGEGDEASDIVGTEVTFRPLTDAEVDAYVATGEPYDKAGGYGIQGGAGAFVASVRGDYYNVVGLPVARVREMLLPHFPALHEP